jgi:hypothetical protein
VKPRSIEAVVAEVRLPDRIREEGVGDRPRAGELLGQRMDELPPEEATHQRHDEGLGEGAVVAVAMVDRQHEPDVVLEHGRGQGADPVHGGAAEIGVEHHERPRLEPPADGEHRAHRLRPVERAVRGVPGPGGPDHAHGAQGGGQGGRRLLGRGLVHVHDHRGLAREVRVQARAHRGGHRGDGGARPGGGQAHHEVGGADPLDGGPDLVGELERLHHRVRWASSAR